LLAGTALPAFAVLTLLMATPVIAAGGTGGNSASNQAGGGAGGSTVTDGTGESGSVGGFNSSSESGGGGGGGGAGSPGGAGGQGGKSGGAGGTTGSPNGQDAVNPGSGGGGGAGGSHGQVGATFNGAFSTGTNGGNGGIGSVTGGGGGGGEGGFGAYLTGAGPHNPGNVSIQGGSGGNGGQGGTSGGLGGNGGDGGIGVYFATASSFNNNSGSIQGGTGGIAGARGASANSGGGTGGAGGAAISGVAGLVITNASGQNIAGGNGGSGNGAQSAGGAGGAGIAVSNSSITNNGLVAGGNGGFIGAGTAGGAGGAGIVGSGLTIINAGLIAGGSANGGSGAQANAITFTGGANLLTLQTGWILNGGIGLQTASTSVNLNQSIAANVANVFAGAGSVINSGTGTLTLSSQNTYSGGTTLGTGSTLQLGVNQVLNGGAIVSSAIGTGTLTFDGGKLQAQASISAREISNAVQVTANGGTIDSGEGFFRFTGNITDATGSSGGKLVFESIASTGVRQVILSGNNSYSGTSYIASGEIVANSTTALSPNSAFQVNKGATLTLLGFSNTIASLADGARGGGLVQNGAPFGTATLTISGAAGGTNSFSGVLQDGTGEGALAPTLNVVKNGPSTQILAGHNTYTGNTTINGGVLEVDGSIASSGLTTVNANGVLTGVGVVGETLVKSGGTLLPGNGTPGSSLSVAGTLIFSSGSLYLVQLSPATSTFTSVSGPAFLNGLAGASFASGSYVSKQYTILTAASGVAGTFSGLQTLGLPSGFKTSLSYDANDAYLNLALNFTPPSSGPNFGGGLNVNQQNVANALTNFFNATGGIPMVFGTLTPAGLTQVSGEVATGSQQTTFDAMNLFMGTMTDPFNRGTTSAPGSGASGYASEGDANAYASTKNAGAAHDAYAMFTKTPPVIPFEQRWSVWAAGFGGSQTTDGNAMVGSNNTTSSVYGTAVGADYRISPFTVAGFALAGGGTNFSVANSGSGHSDLFQAGAFVKHTVGPAYISAALAYGWQEITTNRTVTAAGTNQLRAQFDANAFSGRLEGGYRFVAPWVGGIGITPYAAAQFTTFDLPGYAEQAVVGSNAFALAYGAKDVTDTRSELGLRADKSFAMRDGILTLRGRVAWAHDFDPDRSIASTFQSLPGASFVVNGAAQASDSALVTASVEKIWLNGWSAAATFEGEFSDVTRSYAGKGVVRYVW
jgi:autotransporter-associated beta strand protein